MRTKIISIVIIIALLSIGISAFFLPFTASAAVNFEYKEIETLFAPTQMPDEAMYYELDGTPEFNEEAILFAPTESAMPAGAFTPDGQATVIDWEFEYSGKEFYTFTTPAGNVFYLIVDHARANNNVYLLNAVTETDLISLSEAAGKPVYESAIPTAGQKPINTEGVPVETELPTLEDEAPQKSSNNSGMIIFLVVGAIAFGGAGYYFKIVRPKQHAADSADDEPEDDDEYDEDMQFEDEEEDDDDY